MSQKSVFIRTQLWSVILIVLMVLMGVEILFLANENRKLKETLKRSPVPIKILNPEEKVPSLIGVNLSKEKLLVEYPSSQKTVLFWFSSSCPSCEHNLEFWKEIYRKHRSEKLRFFGITHSEEEKINEFVKKFQLEFPVLIVSDSFLVDQYRVEVIPQTMLIDTNGAVQKVWPGTLSENYMEQIENILSSI